MASIRKLESGAYQLRKMYHGVVYVMSVDYKPRKNEADQLLAAYIEKHKNPSKSKMSFRDAANQYCNVKNNVLSPATIRGYKDYISYIPDSFLNKPVNSITHVDIQDMINTFSVGRSPKTVRNMNSLVSAVMRMMIPGFHCETTLPKPERKDPYIPTEEDIKKLFEAMRGDPHEAGVRLAMYGMRRGEICALTLSDIDFDTCVVTINKDLVMNDKKEWVIKDSAKTENGTRKILISKDLAALIQKQGYIYKLSPTDLSQYLRRTEDKLGMPRFSLHKLRHRFASVAHDEGIPDQYIMEMGGWKSDYVMRRIYTHALQEKELDNMKKMVNRIG